MITKIQGIFEPEILVAYKTISSPGKSIGKQEDLTLRVWGINYADSARTYERIVNGLLYGHFEKEKFVVDEKETAKARKELKVISPRVFSFGNGLKERSVQGDKLVYMLIETMIEVTEQDYLVDSDAAWRFRRLALNDPKYNDEKFNGQVRKGEIKWFKKAPTREHLIQRKKEDWGKTATIWGSEKRVFRLVDLMQ